MKTSSNPREVQFPGPISLSSAPTCGVCNVQIAIGEGFAGVLYETRSATGGREVRHLGECATWTATDAFELREGDLLWSHRYMLSEWGPRIKARVVKIDWKDQDNKGWGSVWLTPADPDDQSPVEGLRTLGEREGHEWATRLADRIGSVDPESRRVYMPYQELVHLKRGGGLQSLGNL
jgi:hypothetical protein